MQLDAHQAIAHNDEVILLSPTGTGKTLAFMLPLIDKLDPDLDEVQLMILCPTRELALQIEQVVRDMGSGYKINAVYGGQFFSKDRTHIKHKPAILIGTPGRVADHLRRESFAIEHIKAMVLDEFDKSLEIGFEKELKFIIKDLRDCKIKVLTSATHNVQIPSFMKLREPVELNHLSNAKPKLTVKMISSPSKDKLDTLVSSLSHLGEKIGIVFCNYRDSIRRVSERLSEEGIPHGSFYGGLEQKDRERALIKFRNGTHRVILATDLAARGLDIPALDYILHYHLPMREEEWIHRNGRTARMHLEGTAYLLKWTEDELPDFIDNPEEEILTNDKVPPQTDWSTLFISGGRKDKISKGDIAGFFFKQAELIKDELGAIELKQDCAFVGIKSSKVKSSISKLNNTRLKKKKVRVYLV